MDGVPFNVLVPAFLGVVVAGMFNTTCIKENTHFPHIVPHGEGVRLNDSKVPRDSIVGMNVMHGEEGSSLVRSERIGLPAYGCKKGVAVKRSSLMMGSSERMRVPIVIFRVAASPLPFPGPPEGRISGHLPSSTFAYSSIPYSRVACYGRCISHVGEELRCDEYIDQRYGKFHKIKAAGGR
jgi:hypothetical protein